MADYIPITDQEIEPEAPITSILQHKLRDNLIAIAEGSPGAPIFQVFAEGLSIATSERSWTTSFSGNIVQGGGIYGKTFEYLGGGSFPNNIYFGDCRLVESAVPILDRTVNTFITVVKEGGDLGQTAKFFVNYNASKPSSNYTWFFILVDIDSGNIESVTYQDHHISFGMSSVIDHPFISEDMTGKDVFVINLTKAQTDLLKIKTIPKTDGSYFTDIASFDNNLIDYMRHRKSVIDVFFESYAIDFNNILPWLSAEKFSVLTPYLSSDLPFLSLPEPDSVTRVDVIVL